MVHFVPLTGRVCKREINQLELKYATRLKRADGAHPAGVVLVVVVLPAAVVGEIQMIRHVGGALGRGPLGKIVGNAAAAHVAQCGSCSSVLESYRQRRQAMAALRDSGIGAGDFADIRRSVLRRLPGERRPHFRFFTRPLLTPLQYGALAALLLAAVTIGTYAWKKAHAPQLVERVAPIKIAPKASIPPSVDARVDPTAESVPVKWWLSARPASRATRP